MAQAIPDSHGQPRTRYFGTECTVERDLMPMALEMGMGLPVDPLDQMPQFAAFSR